MHVQSMQRKKNYATSLLMNIFILVNLTPTFGLRAPKSNQPKGDIFTGEGKKGTNKTIDITVIP